MSISFKMKTTEDRLAQAKEFLAIAYADRHKGDIAWYTAEVTYYTLLQIELMEELELRVSEAEFSRELWERSHGN